MAGRARGRAAGDRLKHVFGDFRDKMTSLMRAQMQEERQKQLARIKALKAMIKGVDVAMAKPDSRAAARNLIAIKKQLAEDLRVELAKFADRVRSRRSTLSKLSVWGR